jgi:hypothetical protein
MKKCCFCGNEKESELHANKGYGGSYAYFCANVDDCWKRIQNNKSAQHGVHLTKSRWALFWDKLSAAFRR